MEIRRWSGTLAQAREAVSRGEWTAAIVLLEGCTDDEVRSAEGLETRALAAYGSGDFEGAVGAWEDLHALHLGNGEHLPRRGRPRWSRCT